MNRTSEPSNVFWLIAFRLHYKTLWASIRFTFHPLSGGTRSGLDQISQLSAVSFHPVPSAMARVVFLSKKKWCEVSVE